MYYAKTLAVVGATLSTLATAVPHNHNHFHKHIARDAEAVAEPVADLEERQVVTVYTTITHGAAAPSGGNKQYQPVAQPAAQATTTTTPAAVVAAQQVNPGNYQQSSSSTSSTSSAQGSSQTGGSTGGGSTGGGSTGGSSSAPSDAVFATDASGNPQLTIKNKCSKSIYVGLGNDAMAELPTGGTKQVTMQGSVVSYKMGWDSQCAWSSQYGPQQGNVEVEYTMMNNGNVSYDLSMEKGNPFNKNGHGLFISEPGCNQVPCAPGISSCPGAYNTQAQDSEYGQPSWSCHQKPLYYVACSEGGTQSGLSS